jgi:hypothetical protein
MSRSFLERGLFETNKPSSWWRQMRELRATLKKNRGISIIMKLITVEMDVGRGSLEGLNKGIDVGMKIDKLIRALASEPPKTFI